MREWRIGCNNVYLVQPIVGSNALIVWCVIFHNKVMMPATLAISMTSCIS